MTSGSKSRYIPIYLDKYNSQHVPVWLQGMPYQVPENIEQMIQRMHNIQPYEIKAAPLKNVVIVDGAKLEQIEKAVKYVTATQHKDCSSEECDKVMY